MRFGTPLLRTGWLLAALGLATATADAGWWSILGKSASKSGDAGATAGKLGVGLYALEDAFGLLARLPNVHKQAALAAHVSPEGHWTFVNKQGDSFTAAYPHEIDRLKAALVPDLPADGKLALYLSTESAFGHGAALKALPADADLHIVAGRDSYPLARGADVGARGADVGARGADAAASVPLQALVRPNLTVSLSTQAAFDEAVFLLGRPLNKSNVRMLAIEPGGPKQLGAVPTFDKTDKTTLVDRIDPAALSSALGKVRGQTVLVMGRVDGDALHVAPSGLIADALSIARLRDAAQAADVNLVVLQTASPRQPGGRNWLWQKVEVGGLKDALAQPTYGDFFNTLGANRGALSVTAVPDGYGRTLLQVLPPPTPGGPLMGGFGPWAGEVADELSGNIAIHGVTAFVRDKEREQELDQRFIPGIPSWIQIIALIHLILGLVAHRVSRGWWARLWPPELRQDYAGAVGFQFARGVRLLAFLALFLPIAGGLSFVWAMLLGLWHAVHAPARWVRSLRGWFTARKTA